jgi:hypothetical protein
MQDARSCEIFASNMDCDTVEQNIDFGYLGKVYSTQS